MCAEVLVRKGSDAEKLVGGACLSGRQTAVKNHVKYNKA